ncbi:hypothetical protein [Escherichia phage pEC-N1203-2Af.1]|nr:hypothetical protein [Escherichia phage pEC-N1203-2Af.1]
MVMIMSVIMMYVLIKWKIVINSYYFFLFFSFSACVSTQYERFLMFELYNYLSGILLPHYLAMLPRGLFCGCVFPVLYSRNSLPVVACLPC